MDQLTVHNDDIGTPTLLLTTATIPATLHEVKEAGNWEPMGDQSCPNF